MRLFAAPGADPSAKPGKPGLSVRAPGATARGTLERQVLPVLFVLSGLLIMPFAARRFMRGEVGVGVTDVLVIVLFLFLGWNIHRTGEYRRSGAAIPFVAFPWILWLTWHLGPVYAYWAFPAMAATFFVLGPLPALATTIVAWLALGATLWNAMPNFDFSLLMGTLLLVPGFTYVFATRARRLAEELEHLSLTDSLTGAGNRRALDARLAQELARQARVKHHTALLVLDLDSFKTVNDTLGHGAGDQVLINVCEMIRGQIRACDGFYRFGGDEFVIVAPDTANDGALALADKLRALVENNAGISVLPLTVTIGIAEIRTGESVEDLLRRVDDALLYGKRSGRNRVHVAAA